jgi:hypothetical protein
MENNEIEELKKLIDSPIANITRNDSSTIIEFENGVILPLYGGSFEAELEIPTCFLCNQPGDNDPLFTIDDKKHICKKCTILALETFIKNGVQIDLNLGDAFPDISEQINKLNENLNNVKDGN